MTELAHASWRKSTRSGTTGNCVEVADNLDAIVAVRDSKDPEGPALTVSPRSWGSFIGEVSAGFLDR